MSETVTCLEPDRQLPEMVTDPFPDRLMPYTGTSPLPDRQVPERKQFLHLHRREPHPCGLFFPVDQACSVKAVKAP